MFTYINHNNSPIKEVPIITVKRGKLEVAELLMGRGKLWYLWKTLAPLWGGAELRELADKLDVLNSGADHEIQIPIQSGNSRQKDDHGMDDRE